MRPSRAVGLESPTYIEPRALRKACATWLTKTEGIASFDCRISQLPTVELVVDYFRWRNEDAHRNALNAHCYWLLRKQGKEVGEATAAIQGMSSAGKNELLFRYGINFNDLPLWQKRGVGLCWEEYDRPAENPITGEKVLARRRRIRRILDLPMKDEYSAYVRQIILDGDSRSQRQ